jgi:hypothetical protein
MKLRDLEGRHAGKEGYCVSCGPSAGALSPQQHAQLSRGRVVVAVKQAIKLVPHANFHLYNMSHAEKWNYQGHRPTTMSLRFTPHKHIPADIETTMRLANYTRDKWLVRTQDWDKWTFDKTEERAWGPGIMLELGIYLFVHLGLTTVYVSGWDCTRSYNQVMPHFYGQHPKAQVVDQEEIDALIEGSRGMYQWMLSRGCQLVLVSNQSELWPGIPRATI